MAILTGAKAETRNYYIAAEEVDWDYAPSGREEMMTGGEFNDDQKVFVERGPSRIGSVYHKLHYVEYTDDSFTEKLAGDDPVSWGLSSGPRLATRSTSFSGTRVRYPLPYIRMVFSMKSRAKGR